MNIHLQHNPSTNIAEILRKNRNIDENDITFFSPKISDLHDPFLMPDMEKAVNRILIARENQERIVIFGDYDVDGVSSTAILVKFLTEIGCQVSYRLPHRVHDGYGLKSYFFDELAEKNVKLVITVDCGTRDIEPIRHAKSLGIDVIVTDHHAVPEEIPTEVIGILNPKRKDSHYPFPNLAGAGVAFKLLHGIIEEMKKIGLRHREWSETQRGDPGIQEGIPQNNWIASCLAMTGQWNLESLLSRYIDLASLWTVADCMPLVGENRTITTLGLKQMKNSESAGLKKFLEGNDKVEGNADVIGFQIGPRINASGRMNTPLTALRWLLASEDRCDEFLEEIEELNSRRQEVVKQFSDKALMEANPDDAILFFGEWIDGNSQKQEVQERKDSSKWVYMKVNEWEESESDEEIRRFSGFPKLEHGLIGLIAGKLTEAYDRPSIVLCASHGNREYENKMLLNSRHPELAKDPESQEHGFSVPQNDEKSTLIASCRSPEWCNLVELLDECKDFFIRYGGHRQAAGFTIEASKFADFQKAINEAFAKRYNLWEIPEKTLKVESILDPKLANLDTLRIIDTFKPFGIGNPKPLWMLENVTITEQRTLGAEGKHISLRIAENPELKLILWNAEERKSILMVGNIVSLIVELEENIWNGKSSVQGMIREVVA